MQGWLIFWPTGFGEGVGYITRLVGMGIMALVGGVSEKEILKQTLHKAFGTVSCVEKEALMGKGSRESIERGRTGVEGVRSYQRSLGFVALILQQREFGRANWQK